MDKILNTKNMKSMLKKKQNFLVKQIEDEKQKVGLSMTNPDNADLASDYANRSRQKSLLGQLEKQLSEVDKALDRFSKGTYGKCVRCGNEIKSERLFALPAAEYCINCQREIDSI